MRKGLQHGLEARQTLGRQSSQSRPAIFTHCSPALGLGLVQIRTAPVCEKEASTVGLVMAEGPFNGIKGNGSR